MNSTASAVAGQPLFHPPADLQWLAQYQEPVVAPELPIIDAHHHLFDRAEWRYGIDEFARDLSSGHKVIATVYLQCGERYRVDGLEAMRCVGETEFIDSLANANAHANAADSRINAADSPASAADSPSRTRLCAAIVGYANLMLGPAVREVLQAHLETSPLRFRGIRHSASADADPAFVRVGTRPALGLLRDSQFRAGFAELARCGLSFDSWQYHPQLPDLLDLAQAFPDTIIVMNHTGGPAGIGGYAGRRDDVFRQWEASIRALARCPNVVAKLGGLGMRFCGFGFHQASSPPSSEQLALAWRPYVDTCIQAFGPQRCMFESNFPVDQLSCSYAVLWNAFKRLAAAYTPAEQASLLCGTAARIYRI